MKQPFHWQFPTMLALALLAAWLLIVLPIPTPSFAELAARCAAAQNRDTIAGLGVHCFGLSLDGAGPGQSLAHPPGVGDTAPHEWVFATCTFRRMLGHDGGATGIDDDFVALLGSGESILHGVDTLALGYRCSEHVATPGAMHAVLTRQAKLLNSLPLPLGEGGGEGQRSATTPAHRRLSPHPLPSGEREHMPQRQRTRSSYTPNANGPRASCSRRKPTHTRTLAEWLSRTLLAAQMSAGSLCAARMRTRLPLASSADTSQRDASRMP
jgi:hypothetical protein